MLLLCFCHTVAGRTGALAGFGLSLAKWAVIVRHSTDLVADSNTWLLWLIMALGESSEALFMWSPVGLKGVSSTKREM